MRCERTGSDRHGERPLSPDLARLYGVRRTVPRKARDIALLLRPLRYAARPVVVPGQRCRREGGIVSRSRVPDAIRALAVPQTANRQEQAKNKPQDGQRAPKSQRPAHWPPGVTSALEHALYVRLERHGIPLGEAQYRFVPGRLYRFDRAWPAPHMVAVEIQGGLWVNGAHSRGSGVERDCVKLSIAAALGWRVLPISQAMIEDGTAVQLIAQALGLEAQ